jgi:hypothetical protein
MRKGLLVMIMVTNAKIKVARFCTCHCFGIFESLDKSPGGSSRLGHPSLGAKLGLRASLRQDQLTS